MNNIDESEYGENWSLHHVVYNPSSTLFVDGSGRTGTPADPLGKASHDTGHICYDISCPVMVELNHVSRSTIVFVVVEAVKEPWYSTGFSHTLFKRVPGSV